MVDRQYICTQFDLCHSQTLSTIDVPSKTVTLREAALHVSLGKQRQFCKCTAGCNTNGVGVGEIRKFVVLDATKI